MFVAAPIPTRAKLRTDQRLTHGLHQVVAGYCKDITGRTRGEIRLIEKKGNAVRHSRR